VSRPLLATDPGIRGTSAALFRDKQLMRCAYIENPRRTGNRAAECAAVARYVALWSRLAPGDDVELAVEWPRVYDSAIRQGAKSVSGKDPNDLLPLAGIDAALAALFPGATTTSYAPSEWKGQMPKEVCHARLRKRLDASELAALDSDLDKVAPSLRHNVLDAVGIGLHHLGRLAPRRGS